MCPCDRCEWDGTHRAIYACLPVWGVDRQAQQTLLNLGGQRLDGIPQVRDVVASVPLRPVLFSERFDVNGFSPPTSASVSAPEAANQVMNTELTSRKPCKGIGVLDVRNERYPPNLVLTLLWNCVLSVQTIPTGTICSLFPCPPLVSLAHRTYSSAARLAPSFTCAMLGSV